jgi:hypothetical protein
VRKGIALIFTTENPGLEYKALWMNQVNTTKRIPEYRRKRVYVRTISRYKSALLLE